MKKDSTQRNDVNLSTIAGFDCDDIETKKLRAENFLLRGIYLSMYGDMEAIKNQILGIGWDNPITG